MYKARVENGSVALVCVLLVLLYASCNSNGPGGNGTSAERKRSIEKEPVEDITYHLISTKDSLGRAQLKSYKADEMKVIMALNRVDSTYLGSLDTLVVPDKFPDNYLHYAPFPQQLAGADSIDKIIFYSYPAEAFAAYEKGILIRWGPISMGKKSTPTPTGLFHTNWNSKETVSTVDDEWIMKWYFNLLNFGGVSMHEYEMPGVPASHSCVRLPQVDAIFFYNWCQPWILDGDETIDAYGTPVIIFGSYPFGQRKPWLGLAENNRALYLNEPELEKELKDFRQTILERQAHRAEVLARPKTETIKKEVKDNKGVKDRKEKKHWKKKKNKPAV